MDLYLVSAGDDIKLWDCNGFILAKQVNPHDQNISSLCWSHDNNFLASVSLHTDGVAITNMKTFGVSTLDCGSGCLCLDLNETSRYMLVGGSDGLISVWDVKSKKIRKTYKDHKGPVTCAKFNHNTSAIASGSETGEIIVYNVVTGQGCRPLVTPQPQAIKQVQYNKFKRSLLGSASDSGSVSLWDCNTRQCIHTFPSHNAPATGLSFSPINDILLMSVGLDKRITFQDTQSKKIVKSMTAESPLTSIDTLHDGVTMFVGSTRGKIYQYDLRMSSVPVRTLEAHKSSVQCLRFQNEIQSETLGTKGVNSKQLRHRQLPISPKSNSNKEITTPSQPDNRPAVTQPHEDIFSPLREGFPEHSIDFQQSAVSNVSGVENHSSSLAPDGYAGGIFSPLNENVTGRSSSALSPLAMNSYSPYMEQRNNSGQVPMDYNRINSQLHTSPNLNSHAPMDTLREIENGLPSIKVSATALSPPTNHYNQLEKNSPSASYKPVQSASTEAPPSNLFSQSATTSETPSASYKPVQSASQKQVAFATEEDPYAFLTNSDSSDSISPSRKTVYTSPHKTSAPSSRSLPRMHLDESPGSVSGGNNIDSVRTLNSQTEGVSAEACAANYQASDSASYTRTESRPKKLELSQPLSGDMAVLANVVRSVVQEEFAAMKRDIVMEVKDEIDDTRDHLHRDIINLQAEMLRMFQIHQNEMMSFIQQYSINEDLISEIEKLQEENKRLKRIF